MGCHCGCNQGACQPDRIGFSYDAGLEASVGNPTRGGFIPNLQIEAVPAPLGLPTEGLPASAPRTPVASLTSGRSFPFRLGKALSHLLVIVQPSVPRPDWVHNYGFVEIQDTLKPALELPRYSYAAIDQEQLIEDAKARLRRVLGR